MPLPRRSPSTASRTSAIGARWPADPEGAGRSAYATGAPSALPELEGHLQHHVTPGVDLESGVPVAEPAVGVANVRTPWSCGPRPGPTRWSGRLLAIGADILDGVAPTEPGMPDRASMPTQPRSTAWATRLSQFSPAATVTTAPPHGASSSTSALTPGVGSRRRSREARVGDDQVAAAAEHQHRSPPVSAAETASISSASAVASTQDRAGPPSRSVVWSGSRSATNDRLGGAEDLLAVAGDLEGHRRRPSSTPLTSPAISTSHRRRLGTTTGLVNLQPAHHLGAGAGVDRPRRERHRVHPVGDDPGQPDARATSSSWWIGLWSPVAAAYGRGPRGGRTSEVGRLMPLPDGRRRARRCRRGTGVVRDLARGGDDVVARDLSQPGRQ